MAGPSIHTPEQTPVQDIKSVRIPTEIQEESLDLGLEYERLSRMTHMLDGELEMHNSERMELEERLRDLDRIIYFKQRQLVETTRYLDRLNAVERLRQSI